MGAVVRVVTIAASLNVRSRSQVLARHADARLAAAGHEHRLIDLREHELPMAGAPGCWEDERVRALREAVTPASHLVLAVPIYNYYANAAAKNAVELLGGSLEGKVVAFLCAAGGRSSYMSVMSLANSLMLDFRCLVLPRFVYATKGDVDGDVITSEAIVRRLDVLCDELVSVRWQPAQAV